MKNSADLEGCYPPRPSASVDNTLLDLQNSSYSSQPHSIISNYSPTFTEHEANNCFSIIFRGKYQELQNKGLKHKNTDPIVREHTRMQP